MKRIILIVSILLSIHIFNESINYENFEIQNKEENSTLYIQYPYFDSVFNYEKINSIILKYVNSIKEQYYNTLKEFNKISTDIGNNKLIYDINSEVFIHNKNYVSILFKSMQYSGGAHPVYEYYVINYDFNKNRIINIQDLFKKKNYLKQLALYCKNNIKEQLKKKGESIDFNIPLKYKTFELFNISSDGIYIIFEDYSILPYYIGAMTVFIPKDDFQNITGSNNEIY